ncbi:RagB/SusD family nutrient uptake outer membrane protein [Leeuwenhoekiella sp. W20_SRS_FM14]|uniref:RagB/SusD family nutrient uptake outer membrane protein n=1 Tax=Leeuwenhoekiella sp. W20_SRS_FM14 TaxID=3240270 RepID=UPI003F98AD5E
MKTFKYISMLFLAGTLSVSCEVDEYSNLNGPEVSDIVADLSRGDLRDLVGGTFYSMRNRLGTYYDDVGVVGREYFRFSSSDPRFTADLLGGENSVLDNNTFYTTGPWSARYRTVKELNIISDGIANSTADFTEAERNATLAYANTIKAHELLLNLNLMDENGIRLDVSDPNNLGPIVGKAEALTEILGLLNESATLLANAGDSFPFEFPVGFTGFDTPATFLEFNRALAARVALYQEDYAGALNYLSNSFLDLRGDLDTGVYYSFSLDATDLPNPMFFPLNASTAGARIVQPSFVTDAEAGDTRLSKVVQRDESLTLDGLTGNYDVFLYPSQTSSIPLIRNEELILIYAEASIFTTPANAVTGINRVRTAAGLTAYTGAQTEAALIDELLKQRRYSLYAEGHRWIDVRRYDRLNTLPLERPNDDVWSSFPIPLNENE